MQIPKGATVLRLYQQSDGSIEIVFENGTPRDYIWSTWEKSNWKSIDWLLGKVENDEFGILKQLETEKDPSRKKVVLLIDDAAGRFRKGEIGVLLENDSGKYDAFVELPGSMNVCIRDEDVRVKRLFYFYKEEIQLIEEE